MTDEHLSSPQPDPSGRAAELRVRTSRKHQPRNLATSSCEWRVPAALGEATRVAVPARDVPASSAVQIWTVSRRGDKS